METASVLLVRVGRRLIGHVEMDLNSCKYNHTHTHTHTRGLEHTTRAGTSCRRSRGGGETTLLSAAFQPFNRAFDYFRSGNTHTNTHTHTLVYRKIHRVPRQPFFWGPTPPAGKAESLLEQSRMVFFSLDFFFIERTARHTHTDTRATASTWSACSCLFHRQEKPND